MHIIWWPIVVKRVAGSPAPRKAKTAAQSTSVWAALRRKDPPFGKLRAGFLAKDARSGAPTFENGFERDISLLWPLERAALAPALRVREHGRARGRSEPGQERFHLT